ncbi:hypothetical protein [Roseinatronobacter sp. S2]|uniref:AtuA-related protein n=1 Tax=Roseinatronobacter sp. S2 TaxID=3035471 RepID=UPI00240F55AB|nr:hypothetical protein [Roseinatronobacter sp. S2]WFE74803.1 hypothetical protein P8S53_16685 [Roseinatronobacter sp. S2]
MSALGSKLISANAYLGGISRSLALDAHGKCLGSEILDLEVQKAIVRNLAE